MVEYPEMRDYVIRSVNQYSGELENWLNDTVLTKTSSLIMTVSLSVISVLKVLWNFIIGFIISIYVLASKEKFTGQAKKMVYAVFKKDVANIVISDFCFTHKTFIGFISGKVLDSIIIGLLCFIGTTFLNTPYAALVSVVIGVTNVIPFFGPYLGAIPSIYLIFIVDPVHPLICVYFAIFILLLQLFDGYFLGFLFFVYFAILILILHHFDGNFLGPKIIGDSTGLTGFWVIFSITLFGGLWGVFGMIVGVPIFAVIYAAIRSMVDASLRKKKLPTESGKYINVCQVNDEGLQEYTPHYKLKKELRDKTHFGETFISNLDEQNIEVNVDKVKKQADTVSQDK